VVEEDYFRLVRRAVTDEDEEALFDLARGAPWAFREVTNQLADLAMRQGGDEAAEESVGGFTRYLISGHLASVYWHVTDDPTLPERLRRMRDWSPQDMREWRKAADLLEQVGSETPPRPRQLEKALAICRRVNQGTSRSLRTAISPGTALRLAGLSGDRSLTASRHSSNVRPS